MDKEQFVWGVYGSVSQVRALAMAEGEATRKRSKNLVVEGVYRLDDLHLTRNQISLATVQETGYLHTDRLQADFRNQLQALLLSSATNRYPGFDAARNRLKSLKELLIDYPGLIQDVFDMDSKISMVVHPVRPCWNPEVRGGIQVATMRRLSSRMPRMEVKHLPRIQINH